MPGRVLQIRHGQRARRIARLGVGQAGDSQRERGVPLGGQHPDDTNGDALARHDNRTVQDQRRCRSAANALTRNEVKELANRVGDSVSALRARAKNQGSRRRGQRNRKAGALLTPQRRRREPGRELCEHAINRVEGRHRWAQCRNQRRLDLRIRPVRMHRYLLLRFGVGRGQAGGALRRAGS